MAGSMTLPPCRFRYDRYPHPQEAADPSFRDGVGQPLPARRRHCAHAISPSGLRATNWLGLFGPVFCLGAVLLLIRCFVTRSFDRWLAVGYAFWVVIFIASEKLAQTDAWSARAAAILKF